MVDSGLDAWDSFLELLKDVPWETLRTWAATLGGLVALFIALCTYRRSVRLKREEQARLVYAKVVHVKEYNPGDFIKFTDHGARTGVSNAAVAMERGEAGTVFVAKEPIIQAVIAVHNGSKELIGPAKVQLVNRGTSTVFDLSHIMGLADPESETLAELTVSNIVAPGWPPLGATVIFRDASGAWWRRHLAEPIEAVHDDPENWIRGPLEREAARAVQIAEGLSPMKEPTVSLRVKWHRFKRRLRRKPPIP